MELGHHIGRLCHGGNDIVCEVHGIRRREADAVDAGLSYLAEKLCKPGLPVDVRAVGVHVLAQKRDFAHAVSDKPVAFEEDGLHRARALASTDIRHDAVGAEVVAPRHDRHPGVIAELSMARKLGREMLGVFLRIDEHLVLLLRVGLDKKLRQRCQGAGAEDDIDTRYVLLELCACTLRYAATDGHDALAGRRKRSPCCIRCSAIEPRIGSFTH